MAATFSENDLENLLSDCHSRRVLHFNNTSEKIVDPLFVSDIILSHRFYLWILVLLCITAHYFLRYFGFIHVDISNIALSFDSFELLASAISQSAQYLETFTASNNGYP